MANGARNTVEKNFGFAHFLYTAFFFDIQIKFGMWSIWMASVPSLRARDCSANEKDALNVAFVVRENTPFIYA